MSRFGVPQNGASICDHAGLRHKRDVGGMMGHMPVNAVMNSSMMHDPMMHGHMMRGRMMDGPMMHGDILPSASPDGKEKLAHVDVADGKQLPEVNELMLPGQMMPDVGDMMTKAHDSVGVQLADVLSNPDNRISAQQNDDDNDSRDLIIPIGSQARDISHYRNHMDFISKHHLVGLSAGESCFYCMTHGMSYVSFVCL